MKRSVLLTAIIAFLLGVASIGDVEARSKSSGGSHSVRGYTKKDGTYVAPHRRTNPNSGKTDNWSTKGNVNPYTGKRGTKEP